LKKTILLFIASVYFFGCSPTYIYKAYYDIPQEFKNDTLYNKFYNDYSFSIKGVKFFLDPGHGGDDRTNKGPQGLTTEADANLRVALFLRDFLTQAGAIVVMSRDKDSTVGLKDRSIMANSSGADIFISIHHNAPGKAGDDWTNYTSTYYHAKEENYEYEPMERDLARYVQRDLAYAMRNSGGLGSFDGTYSDYWIYPGSGFSVLRLTEIPAILIECGFHTHRWEEERLATEEFNKIQAWGIFRGICKYFANGIPKIEFVNKEISNKKLLANFIVKDKFEIDPSSVKVFCDSLSVNNFNFNSSKSLINVELPLDKDNYLIKIVAANKNGNHSFPFQQIISTK